MTISGAFAVALAIFLLPNAVQASEAGDLAMILASEKPCGLTYDQAAIRDWIAKNVPADDMSFPDDLASLTRYQVSVIADMPASSLTAHCAQITRIARATGIIH